MRTQPQGDAPQVGAAPSLPADGAVVEVVTDGTGMGTGVGAASAEPAGLFDDLDVGALYDQLRGVARVPLRKEGPGLGGAPSSLVNDAMLRLSVWGRERRATGMPVWGSPEEFFALAVQVMQRVIIDRARRQRSLKRGGPGSGTGAVRSLRVEVDLASLAEGSGAIAAGWGGSKGAAGAAGRDEQPGGAAWASTPGGAGGEPDWETLEELQRALEELRQVDQRCYEVVNLRFYLGLTTAEVAEVRQCDRQQVEQDWRMARAWLLRRMNQPTQAEPTS